MRRLILTPILVLFIFVLSLQAQTEWHQATISLKDKSIKELLHLGIALDHGYYQPGVSFSGDFTTSELDKVHNAGFQVELTSYIELKSSNSIFCVGKR